MIYFMNFCVADLLTKLFVLATYGCAPVFGINPCLYESETLDVQQLITNTDQLAAAGGIDSTLGMAGDKIYIFNGASDTIVYPGMDQQGSSPLMISNTCMAVGGRVTKVDTATIRAIKSKSDKQYS